MTWLSLPFVQAALAAGLLAGNALALTGAFILMRRVAFSGLAVSQLAALGTAVGVSIGAHNIGVAGTALAAVAAGMLVQGRLTLLRSVPEEAWVAALYVGAAGAGVLLLSKDPQGEAHTMSVFFGNVLALGWLEVLEAAALLLAALALFGVWFRRWVYLFFDPESAEVAGVPVRRWNIAFICLFAYGMTTAIHLFGVLLAFAFLLMPAAAGLAVCRSLRGLFLFIPLMTSACVLLGTWASFVWDFPTGPMIAALLSAAALVAGLYRTFSRL